MITKTIILQSACFGATIPSVSILQSIQSIFDIYENYCHALYYKVRAIDK